MIPGVVVLLRNAIAVYVFKTTLLPRVGLVIPIPLDRASDELSAILANV